MKRFGARVVVVRPDRFVAASRRHRARRARRSGQPRAPPTSAAPDRPPAPRPPPHPPPADLEGYEDDRASAPPTSTSGGGRCAPTRSVTRPTRPSSGCTAPGRGPAPCPTGRACWPAYPATTTSPPTCSASASPRTPRTSRWAWRTSAEERANALLQLLDVLGVERAHLVGNSMGGMVSLLLLTAQPDRFDRAILMGSGGAPMTPTPDLLVDDHGTTTTPHPSRCSTSSTPSCSTPAATATPSSRSPPTAPPTPPDPTSDARTNAPSPSTGPPLVFTPEELADIHHEVLLRARPRGPDHPRSPRRHHLAQHLPNAQLHVLPHTGHWVQIEQADRFRRPGRAVPR